MPTSNLISILRENMEQHIQEYETALKGWQQDYATQLQEEFNRVHCPDWDGSGPWYMTDPVPQSYAVQYEEMISQLEHDIRDTVELTSEEYRRYVLDKWQWKESFTSISSKYIG